MALRYSREWWGEICTSAAKVIERDGFRKGGYGYDHGPKCAMGAIRFAAVGTTTLPLGTQDGLIKLFKEVRPRSKRDTIVAFNDAKRTRKHDVIELLRAMGEAGASVVA